MLKFSAVSQIWKKYIQKLNDWDLPLNSAIKKAKNECRFNRHHITKKKAIFQCHAVYSIMTSFMTLSHQCKHLNMVPLDAPYPDVYTDTFIFFSPIIVLTYMDVHYFPNAPRTYWLNSKITSILYNILYIKIFGQQTKWKTIFYCNKLSI